jgi:hypothetical protein
MKESLSAPETARALNIGLNRCYNLLATGRLPGKLVNGRWQIAIKDIETRKQEVEKYKR